jgi:hypothetical protein
LRNDSIFQIISISIAWKNEAPEPSGRRGGSSLQSRDHPMTIAR